MEKWFDLLFDLKKIPVKLVFVIWLCATLMFASPDSVLAKLHLDEFQKLFGKYFGVIFIVCSALLLVALLTTFSHMIKRRLTNMKIEKSISEDIYNLDPHEKAILREFFLQNKHSLNMPMDNPTVLGLASKGIIYQVSDNGFVYIHGAYYSYSITRFAKGLLTNELIDLPKTFTDTDKERLRISRPSWINNSTF